MTFITVIDDPVLERFKMAVSLAGETEQQVITELMKQYYKQIFAQEAQQVGERPSTQATVNSNYPTKAVQRIPRWATHPEQMNHNVIRAYFAVERDGRANREEMKQYFLTHTNFAERQFDTNFQNLCTEGGNASGRVFLWDGSVVRMDEISGRIARQYRQQFYPTA